MTMKLKKIGTLLSGLALMAGLLVVPASAAEVEDGVYTASMVTSYYNPDTGNVDDGGTANAALGEGMCRSATDKTCLVEVDGDDVWITVRLLLQSNCSNVALYSRSGYDSYSQLSYDIMSEDAGNDSIDYRIKVSDVGQKLKCTMYVSPMGRDVLWYLYVDTSTLTPGSDDFVVSIDTSKESSANSAVPATATEPAQNPATSAKPADAPAPSKEPADSTNSNTPSEGPETPADAEEPEDTSPPDESGEPEDTTAPEDTTEDTEEPADSEEPEPSKIPDQSGAGDGEENTSETSSGSTVQVALVLVIVAAVIGVIYFVKRKTKK